jgi:ATP-dependent protease ClpP protease subunit
MKKLILILSIVLLAYPLGWAEEEETPKPVCPVTLMDDSCMNCHAMRVDKNGKQFFGLKERGIIENYNGKPTAISDIYSYGSASAGGIIDGLAAYMIVDGTNSSKFRLVANYLKWHPEITKLVVELHTPGGSIMDAWRSVGIIKEMQAYGVIVEMRVYGMSASAGAIIMVAGDIGHRFVNPSCEIMIHKIWTFKMFSLSTPDSAEDEAEILRHFQRNINGFILSRSKMTKKQLDESIYKKDFWMTGAEAVLLGLADGFI